MLVCIGMTGVKANLMCPQLNALTVLLKIPPKNNLCKLRKLVKLYKELFLSVDKLWITSCYVVLTAKERVRHDNGNTIFNLG